MFYWIMKTLVAGPLLRALFRPRLEGLGNIPATGPVILASNHLSFIDSVILPLVMRRRIYFLAASSYFERRGLGGWAVGRFLRATGMIPIDRSGGWASEASLRAGMTVLTAGRVLGIYPEGSRSRDGRARRGRTGVARLALESGAPVVPVAMIGTDEVMPSGGGGGVRIRRIGISFGEPLDFAEFAAREPDRATLRTMTDRIMLAVVAMSGQEYIDEYAVHSSSTGAGSAG
jgi:1-acyl-sn-glycerol-3-phosphate acyltransferase